MPNKVANLAPGYQGNPDDPDRVYSIPWQGGFAGIGYNKQAYKEATGKDEPATMSDLWAAELKGPCRVAFRDARHRRACSFEPGHRHCFRGQPH